MFLYWAFKEVCKFLFATEGQQLIVENIVHCKLLIRTTPLSCQIITKYYKQTDFFQLKLNFHNIKSNLA